MITFRDLRRRREQQGKTLQDMVDKCGVSMMFLSYVETGQRRPSEKTIRKIGRAYGMTSPEIRSLMESFGMYDQEYVDALRKVQEAQRKLLEQRIAKQQVTIEDLKRQLAELIGF